MRNPSLAAAAVALGLTTFFAKRSSRLVKALVPAACHHHHHVRRSAARSRSSLGASKRAGGVAERIHQIAGREFDIGKPSVLAKVLYDDMSVFNPQAGRPEELTAAGRPKARSVSVKTLSAVLEAERDPAKRELVELVLRWLDAKAVAKRGGFVASGEKVADIPSWSSRLIPDDDELPADPSASPVVIVDGHYITYRSFHGMPHLSAADGTPVGALVGFCNAMNKLVVQPWAEGVERRRKVVVVFDTGDDNFRHDLSPSYKKHRTETPEDLR
ncbi:unnamed protein product, partial [Ectocarpus sp. 12 AP-2014]